MRVIIFASFCSVTCSIVVETRASVHVIEKLFTCRFDKLTRIGCETRRCLANKDPVLSKLKTSSNVSIILQTDSRAQIADELGRPKPIIDFLSFHIDINDIFYSTQFGNFSSIWRKCITCQCSNPLPVRTLLIDNTNRPDTSYKNVAFSTGPPLLTWINLNSCMDKYSQTF